jgi:hypothetical protein
LGEHLAGRPDSLPQQIGVVPTSGEDVGHYITPIDSHEVHDFLRFRTGITGQLASAARDLVVVHMVGC